MNLDARAVVLVLERGSPAVGGQRFPHSVRDLGEHGQERDEDARLGGR